MAEGVRDGDTYFDAVLANFRLFVMLQDTFGTHQMQFLVFRF